MTGGFEDPVLQSIADLIRYRLREEDPERPVSISIYPQTGGIQMQACVQTANSAVWFWIDNTDILHAEFGYNEPNFGDMVQVTVRWANPGGDAQVFVDGQVADTIADRLS